MEFREFRQIAKIRVAKKHLDVVTKFLAEIGVKFDVLTKTTLMLGVPRGLSLKINVGNIAYTLRKHGIKTEILQCRIVGVPIVTVEGE